ncbi:GNAT family N-acetyltransferase [Streptomyces fradiae]|uniref:GNAT family N-acetyltransferase n=1 Tax=Streptomyces fradiae TaxID=1906 RepID=UPI003515CE30
MSWHFTTDPAAFPDAARDFVAAAPERNTGLLTLLDAPGTTRGWWMGQGEADGAVSGACLLVDGPGMLLLGVMQDAAARALAAALPETGHAVREARGEAATVDAFAAPFAAATGRVARTSMRLRLFRLGELTAPRPVPPGAARSAVPGDVPLLLEWMSAYAGDVGEDPGADYSAPAEAMVREGRLRFWETDGRPVAMASFSRPAAGQARVSLVYTPPAHRARGYAGAVTTEAGRAARAAGAAQVLLFTDRANPTSNALYQRLGYRPIADHTRVAFPEETENTD